MKKQLHKCPAINNVCYFYTYQTDNNGEIAIEHCTHKYNPEPRYEGNCTKDMCPVRPILQSVDVPVDKPTNALQVNSPEHLTVETLREYLNKMEILWSTMDTKVLGKFEKQKINIMHHEKHPGIGDAKIIYDGGLDFIILPKE